MTTRMKVTVSVPVTFTYDSDEDGGRMEWFYGTPVTPEMLREWARATVAVAGVTALEDEGAAYGVSNVTSPDA